MILIPKIRECLTSSPKLMVPVSLRHYLPLFIVIMRNDSAWASRVPAFRARTETQLNRKIKSYAESKASICTIIGRKPAIQTATQLQCHF